MPLDAINIIPVLVGLFVGAFGIISALFTSSENRRLKRQEIILPLMREFDENKKIYYAKELIDGVSIQLKHDNETISDMPINLKYFDKNKILRYKEDYLRFLLAGHPHQEVELNQDEVIVRTIFDALLSFFGKLGYLMDTHNITKKELGYFMYEIQNAKDNWAVIQFTINLKYELFAVLLDKLKLIKSLEHAEQSESLKHLAEQYYKRNKS